MTLTIELPDEIARVLSADGDLSRRVLEALALEELRAGRLSQAGLRRLLGFPTRYELDGFLKAHDIFVDYPLQEFEQDLETLRNLGV